jgi:hypothetical protein
VRTARRGRLFAHDARARWPAGKSTQAQNGRTHSQADFIEFSMKAGAVIGRHPV